MNITVRSTLLAQELRLMAKIVPGKASLPILNHAYFHTTEEGLALETTNLTMSMRSVCPANVSETGRTTLPTKKILELLEWLPDTDVNIAVGERDAVISAGTFKSRMQTMPAIDFPTLPNIEGTAFSVLAVVLRHLIERAAYAISEKTDKYVIDGALLSLNGPVMAMVATDGKRLTVATAARADGPPINMLIPRQTLDMLMAFLEDGEVEFSIGTNHLFFKVGPRTLISRMIDGNFPKYHKIIPQDCDKHVTLDRTVLAAALRRVLVMAEEANETVDFIAGPGGMRLASRSAGFGDADEGVPAEYNGEAIRVSASGKHVLEFLDRATEKNVTLALKTVASPMLWTDGSDFLNVILVRKP